MRTRLGWVGFDHLAGTRSRLGSGSVASERYLDGLTGEPALASAEVPASRPPVQRSPGQILPPLRHPAPDLRKRGQGRLGFDPVGRCLPAAREATAPRVDQGPHRSDRRRLGRAWSAQTRKTQRSWGALIMDPRRVWRGLALALAIALWAVVEFTHQGTDVARGTSGSTGTVPAVPNVSLAECSAQGTRARARACPWCDGTVVEGPW